MIGADAPNARTSDPLSSHLANIRIRTNKTLKDLVLWATLAMSVDDFQDPKHLQHINDDMLLIWIEDKTRKRQQRNVLARTRGLLERDGLISRVGTSPRVTYVPSPELLSSVGIDDQIAIGLFGLEKQ